MLKCPNNVSRKFPIVLVIDDAPKFTEFCKTVIEKSIKWVRVRVAKDGIEGLKAYKKYNPDLVLLDLNMPKLDGISVLKAIMKDNFNVKVVVTTAYDDSQETINQMIKLGAHGFLPKPMNLILLTKTISDALYNGKVAGTHNKVSKSFVLNHNYN